MRSSFFSFQGGWGEGFFFLVPNAFSSCSHEDPIRFPSSQDVPNNPLDLSHMVCPKFNSHVYKLRKVGYRGAHLFPFCSWDPKRCFYWGVPNVPKELMIISQSIWLLQKEKEKVVSAPMN